MTQKRFRKMLMANGASRNQANKVISEMKMISFRVGERKEIFLEGQVDDFRRREEAKHGIA